MPPAGDVLSSGDLGVMRTWIRCGAEDFDPRESRPWITVGEMIALIRADLEGIDPISWRFTRYQTLTHLRKVNNIHRTNLIRPGQRLYAWRAP